MALRRVEGAKIKQASERYVGRSALGLSTLIIPSTIGLEGDIFLGGCDGARGVTQSFAIV